MRVKYRALRFVVGLYRVLAWVVLALGVLAAIGVIIASTTGGQSAFGPMMGRMTSMPAGIVGGLVAALLILLYTALLFVLMWAGSEFVAMLMDIEHNTRETAYYLKGELEAAPPRAEPVNWQQPGPTA
jgi:hypothetical protein